MKPTSTAGFFAVTQRCAKIACHAFLVATELVAQYHIMRPALDNPGRGDKRQLCLVTELWEWEYTAVAHS